MLHYRLAGFFEREELIAFNLAADAAFMRLSCGPNQHVSLINVSDCSLQSQAVVAGFQHMLGRPQRRALRTAFVLKNSLSRMQVRRLIEGREDAAMFDDEASALTWLRGAHALAA